MYSNSRFLELGQSLGSGFFADRAVLALAHAEKQGKARSDDLQILQRMISFLKQVLNGHDWILNREMNESSVKSAIAFSEAVRAIPDIKNSQQFKAYINERLYTANSLLKQKEIDLNSIKDLRRFFCALGRSELIRSENLIEDNIEEIVSHRYSR